MEEFEKVQKEATNKQEDEEIDDEKQGGYDDD